MALWLTSPKKYADLYFDNRDELRTTNSGQIYGKVVSDALEQENETGDLLTDSAMLLLPKYDIRDKQFDVDVKTKDGWLKLVAKPDFMDSTTKNFVEVKTGVHPWTQSKAQNHLQMIFYAVVIWQKYGVKNAGAKLAWIETERVMKFDDTGRHIIPKIIPTGRVETFDVTFTSMQYLDTLQQMVTVAKEIEIAWASHVTNPELINF